MTECKYHPRLCAIYARGRVRVSFFLIRSALDN